MKFVQRLVIAVVSGLTLAACDNESSVTGPSSRQSVRGRVLDYLTQQPVAGAVVRFTFDVTQQQYHATTNISGSYELPGAPLGRHTVMVNEEPVGLTEVTGTSYRGDLFVNWGTCVAKYGAVVDARSLRPVAGATVSIGIGTPGLGSATTGPDGWYRIDMGCPASGCVAFNTTLLHVTHPNYAPGDTVVGRGVCRVGRRDVKMTPR
jgi:hypothetical protein